MLFIFIKMIESIIESINILRFSSIFLFRVEWLVNQMKKNIVKFFIFSILRGKGMRIIETIDTRLDLLKLYVYISNG
jgi:hypothetical protein